MPRIISSTTMVLYLIFFTSHLSSQTLNPKVSTMFEKIIDSIEPTMPNVNPLFKYHMRDVAVSKGPNKKYYLTGTTDDNWGVAEGIRVWESSDLKHWEIIGDNGFVWTFDKNACNEAQKKVKIKKGRLMRGIWAPEIYYMNNNFWITYSISNGYGSGLLRSTTGKPEGPYEDIKKDGALVKGIDATLFKDTDGSVWYIWGPGNMKKFNADMSAFANDAPPTFPKDINGNKIGYEGVNMYYNNGMYYLMAAEWNAEGPKRGHVFGTTNTNRRTADGRYDCMIAMAKTITGPYSKTYLAIPHGGHNVIFDDFEGNIWATMFGNDESAAQWRENPALVQMQIDNQKRLVPFVPYPYTASSDMPIIYVSKNGNNTNGKSWKSAYTSLQKAIDKAETKTQIWVAKGNYDKPIDIDRKTALYIYGGFQGVEKSLSERTEIHQTLLNGKEKIPHILSIKNSQYIRIDGLTITGGKNMGQKKNGSGAGIWLEHGGESVRFINCTIENNYAVKDGAGIHISNGASPLFVGCNISNNEAHLNGGAIYANCNTDNGYHTRFYNCNISKNKAQANGGIAWFVTDQKQTGTLRFMNCLLNNNFTLLESGNIVMNGGASLLMSQCTVVNNKGMSKGASIAQLGNVPAHSRIINSIFSNNYGGTLFVANAFQGEDPTTAHKWVWAELQNNLFNENKTLSLCRYSYKAHAFKNVAEINATDWASDNLEGQPDFLDIKNNDFRLGSNSKAIGSGTLKNTFPIDFYGTYRFGNFDTTSKKNDVGFIKYVKE